LLRFCFVIALFYLNFFNLILSYFISLNSVFAYFGIFHIYLHVSDFFYILELFFNEVFQQFLYLCELSKDHHSVLEFIFYLCYNFYSSDWGLFFLNFPVFIFFYFLFFLTTFTSFFLISYLGLYGVFFYNFFPIFFLFFFSSYYFDFFFYYNTKYSLVFFKWIVFNNNVTVFFEFILDSLSYSFAHLTITIGFFVYMYVFSYFRYDANVEKLSLYINGFVLSMVCLIYSGNLVVFYLGWELIGLTSFLLINFWSTRISTLKSAFKAYAFNKFSDVFVFLGILVYFNLFGDFRFYGCDFLCVTFYNFFLDCFFFNISAVECCCFFFLISAFIKSAQIGWHIWLPDSMEAPVPASALIHSATLVSAGIYLILRLSFLFELSWFSYHIILIFGSITALYGSVCAGYQSDVKRILAYSTISHCGFLMVTIVSHIPQFTIFYLYVHGFFKATVFLCAGNLIRISKNYQDFRRMGFFWRYSYFDFFASFSYFFKR